jgi:hypothetical protein
MRQYGCELVTGSGLFVTISICAVGRIHRATWLGLGGPCFQVCNGCRYAAELRGSFGLTVGLVSLSVRPSIMRSGDVVGIWLGR